MYAPAATTKINELEAALGAERSAHAAALELVSKLTAERDLLKASHERLRLELELLRRRIFVAKAERVDTAQLELEFAATLAALDQLGGGPPVRPAAESVARPKPKGRRDLRDLKLPVERVESFDVLFEKLVAEGKAERFGFEESSKVAWQRGGARLLVPARAKYRTVDADGESAIETTPMAPELFPRSLVAPSFLAHVISEKFCGGLPLNRIEDRMGRDGFPLDRGTMCRWVEDAGATAGATVIAAARAEAWRTAFCIATDATDIEAAQQLWYVCQTTTDHRGETVTVEQRYFVSSIPTGTLTRDEELALVRMHWAIENGCHWTMDAMLGEDENHPCQASRASIETVSWLRIIGYNAVSAWRRLAPTKDRRPMAWARAMETLRDALLAAQVADHHEVAQAVT